MTLRPSRALALSSAKAASAALASLEERQALSRPMASVSTESGTVTTALSPAERGDGSLLVKRLTPTTTCSPRSIASMRRAPVLHQRLFHVAALDGERAPPMASIRASSCSAAAFSSATLASITVEPSKMSS